MTSSIRTTLVCLSVIAGTILTLWIIIDLPIALGWVIADAPDYSKTPPGLKGVYISPFELPFKALLTVACFTMAIILWRSRADRNNTLFY